MTSYSLIFEIHALTIFDYREFTYKELCAAELDDITFFNSVVFLDATFV